MCMFAQSKKNSNHKNTYLLIHGAWGGGWDWKIVDSLLTLQGNTVYRVTLTGLGERSHLLNKNIGLETHFMDVINTIYFENLHDVILLGHSYGGMVITGVAEKIPERIKKLIYVDALLPFDGESLLSAQSNSPEKRLEEIIAISKNDTAFVPDWVSASQAPPKDVPHPLKTFTDKISINNPKAKNLHGLYILTVDSNKKSDEDAFYKFAQRAKNRLNFKYIEMLNTSHIPERTLVKSIELVNLLLKN